MGLIVFHMKEAPIQKQLQSIARKTCRRHHGTLWVLFYLLFLQLKKLWSLLEVQALLFCFRQKTQCFEEFWHSEKHQLESSSVCSSSKSQPLVQTIYKISCKDGKLTSDSSVVGLLFDFIKLLIMNESNRKKLRQIPLTAEYNKLVSSAIRSDNELAQHQKYMLNNKMVTSCFLPLS